MANFQLSQSQNFAEKNNSQMWAPFEEPPPTFAPPCFNVPPPSFRQPPVHPAATTAPPPPPPPPPPPLPPPFCATLPFPPPTGQSEAIPDGFYPKQVPQQISHFKTQMPATSLYQETPELPVTDESWVEQFLSRKRISLQPKTFQKGIKNYEAKEMLKNCLYTLEELKETHRKLLSAVDSMNSSEWQTEIDVINKKKADVLEKLQQLNDPVVLNTLKVSVAKRRKKRKSQKRRRENLHFLKAEKELQRQRLHREIDTWLEKMQESVEKAKLEESLKLEADAVLSDVTKKKAEARRHLALLSALARLRKLRAQAAVGRGERVSSELEACFSRVIDNLKSLWEEKLEEFMMEEKGLRVMLTEAVDERKISYDRTVLAQWKKLLFGSQQSEIHPFYCAAERSVQDFISIRRSWDKCLASPSAPMSSAIPIGWVLPTNPSSGAWEKLLSCETQDD